MRTSPLARGYHKPILTPTPYSPTVSFTAEEKDEIDSASRWLRRVVHPFDSFEQMIVVGFTPSVSSQGSNQPRARRDQLYSARL